MIGIDAYDFGGNDLADAHFLACEAFLEHCGKRFTRDGRGDCIRYLHIKNLKKPIVSMGSG
jgi:hypothetical protein